MALGRPRSDARDALAVPGAAPLPLPALTPLAGRCVDRRVPDGRRNPAAVAESPTSHAR